jgi:GUN4-like
MDATLLAAIIGAVATLVAAVLPLFLGQKRRTGEASRVQRYLNAIMNGSKSNTKSRKPVLSIFSTLENLLVNKQWQEADQETALLMLKICSRTDERVLTIDDLKNFPVQELKVIDQLWLAYSNQQFGFSVQEHIWQNIGSGVNPGYQAWCEFGDRVGWRQNGDWLTPYVNLDKSIPGLLPWAWGNHLVGVAVGQSWWIFSRLRSSDST